MELCFPGRARNFRAAGPGHIYTTHTWLILHVYGPFQARALPSRDAVVRRAVVPRMQGSEFFVNSCITLTFSTAAVLDDTRILPPYYGGDEGDDEKYDTRSGARLKRLRKISRRCHTAKST